MKPLHKYIFILLIINILLIGIAYPVVSIINLELLLSDIAILSASFTLIALLTLLIFLRGLSKEPDSQTMHSLVAITLKFLLDMVLALVWFLLTKKTSLTSVLIFFVIYLTLSLFSLSVILKTLKKRSL